MPTVTQLADRCSTKTGLTGTAERIIILDALNQAYEQACAEAGTVVIGTGSVALTSGTDDYVLGTAPFNTAGFIDFRRVWLSGGGTPNMVLEARTEDDIRDAREGSSSSTSYPYWYAVDGANLLMLYPMPGAGLTLMFSYEKSPSVLVESAPTAGQESTPTAFPSAYHYSVLTPLALQIIFEYKRDVNMASYYRGLYVEGLRDLQGYVGRVGGSNALWLDGGVAGVSRKDSY